jgi:hypothetical protein
MERETVQVYASRPRSETVRRQGRYERKWLPSKKGEPFVSWISTFTGLLLAVAPAAAGRGQSRFYLPTGRRTPHTLTTKAEASSMTDYQTDGLAVLVLMMNF